MTPGKIVSAKGLAGVLKDFFGRSQLSQFMDQTNTQFLNLLTNEDFLVLDQVV